MSSARSLTKPCLIKSADEIDLNFSAIYNFSGSSLNDSFKYVNLNLDILKSKELKFLLDTGADISVVKRQFINENSICNPNIKCTIKGITEENVYTLAVCDALISLSDEVQISHPFHIVPESFPINCVGILGKDFLEQFSCSIDYGTKLLKIRAKPDIEVKIPYCRNSS